MLRSPPGARPVTDCVRPPRKLPCLLFASPAVLSVCLMGATSGEKDLQGKYEVVVSLAFV